MDMQTRKLNLIEYLINIDDEKIFSRIESSIIGSKKPIQKPLKSFTQSELVERSKLAEKDYKVGKFISQELLELESENW